MSAATPGPWVAYDHGRDSYGRQLSTVAADNGNVRICELIQVAGLSLHEVKANAQLLAAAPELRDALQAALRSMDSLSHACFDVKAPQFDLVDPRKSEVIKQARSLLSTLPR